MTIDPVCAVVTVWIVYAIGASSTAASDRVAIAIVSDFVRGGSSNIAPETTASTITITLSAGSQVGTSLSNDHAQKPVMSTRNAIPIRAESSPRRSQSREAPMANTPAIGVARATV